MQPDERVRFFLPVRKPPAVDEPCAGRLLSLLAGIVVVRGGVGRGEPLVYLFAEEVESLSSPFISDREMLVDLSNVGKRTVSGIYIASVRERHRRSMQICRFLE